MQNCHGSENTGWTTAGECHWVKNLKISLKLKFYIMKYVKYRICTFFILNSSIRGCHHKSSGVSASDKINTNPHETRYRGVFVIICQRVNTKGHETCLYQVFLCSRRQSGFYSSHPLTWLTSSTNSDYHTYKRTNQPFSSFQHVNCKLWIIGADRGDPISYFSSFCLVAFVLSLTTLNKQLLLLLLLLTQSLRPFSHY